MTGILDSVFAATESRSAYSVIAENHDAGSINFVAGMSDPGEMVGCGAYQQLRRHAGETDHAYAVRLREELAKIPTEHREIIETALRSAALRRASLDTTGGRVAMFAVGADGSEDSGAWHGLGVRTDRAVSARDAIKLAGLDWEARKIPVQFLNPVSGQMEIVPDRFAVVRMDSGAVLGNVGRVYNPLQNSEGFDFLDSVIGEFGAHYETAGALYNGSTVWMQLRIPSHSFSINGKDETVPFVLFTNSHDGTSAAECYATAQRTVCRNTLRLAGNSATNKFRARHTGNLRQKVQAAREQLGFAVREIDEYRECAEVMARTPIDAPDYFNRVIDATDLFTITAADASKGADLLASILQVTETEREIQRKSLEREIRAREKLMEDILSRYDSETNGVNGMRGTAWSAFNAVTESANWGRLGGRYNGSESERRDKQFESVLSGAADRANQVAYQTVRAMIS